MSLIFDERWSELADAEVWRDIEAGITILIATGDEEDIDA